MYTVQAQISAEQTLAIAQNLIDNEDYALAVQYLGKTVKAKPYLCDPYYLRAYAKMMLGDYAGAEADCSTALELNSFKREPYRIRGICRIRQGKDSLALADFTAGLSQTPDDRSFLYYAALCHANLGNNAEGIASFSRLEKLYPTFTQAFTAHAKTLLSMRDTIGAVRVLDKISGKGRISPQPTLMRANIALAQRRWHDAATELDNAVSVMPHNDALYVNRGTARFHTGDRTGAISDYRTAIEINPDNATAAANLKAARAGAMPALCLITLPDEAMLPYKHQNPAAARPATEQPCGLFALTFTHPYDDLHPLAYPYHELPVVNLAGDFPSPLYLSSSAADTPDPEQAVALFAFAETELKSTPRAAQLLGRAVAYAMLKNYDSALVDIDRAIAMQPDWAVAYLERAFVREAMAQAFRREMRRSDTDARLTADVQAREALALALEDLDKALAIDPNMQYALYDKAQLLAKGGNTAAAIQCYDRAIELNPSLAQAYYNRALLHKRGGHTAQAQADLSRAGELGIAQAYTVLRSLKHN